MCWNKHFLETPDRLSAAEGARFEVHYEKHRGFYGADAEPFEAKLEMRNSTAVWTTRKLDDVNRARVEIPPSGWLERP